VARHLIEAIASWAATDSARSLSLWVFEQNKAAINCYERLGFTGTGRSKPYDSRQEMHMIMSVLGWRPEAGTHPAEF
jgi:ribosomal protein S18 acetylase RimI-like enzyme